MSAIPPLLEDKQTRGEWTENAANDPQLTFATICRLGRVGGDQYKDASVTGAVAVSHDGVPVPACWTCS
jgi:hypothetical protein